jgi:signal transduction histidine kinase
MSSKIAEPKIRSAAWRISLWATLAFACGTLLVFVFLHNLVSHDIQRRSDAWLSGELGVLGDVAKRTPRNSLYGRVVGEVAELASREIPNKRRSSNGLNDSVFFLQTAADGSLALWVGEGNGSAEVTAVRESRMLPDIPSDLHVKGVETPFRVASVRMQDGSQLYLGLSEKDELRILKKLRLRFFFLWLLLVLLGFAIVFYSTRRMLGHVREIAEAASRIGKSDMSSRVPTAGRKDEVAHLAFTLNHMLDRIERTIHQLHTITDSLAHDLRSPLTAIRAKLEISLSADARGVEQESIVSAIDELDRLTEMLNKSLDVAEANADALKLDRIAIDLEELLRVMIGLYEPCMSEKGLRIQLSSAGTLMILADAALLHRMIANLLDNELKHLPGSCMVTISLRAANGNAFLVLEDDGPGFAPEIGLHMFEARIKGLSSTGHGLGLAFVEAVVRAHGGSVTAANRTQGGAQLSITWPLATAEKTEAAHPLALANG